MSVLNSELYATETPWFVSRSSRFILWSLYVGFVVYGSLVPLDFHYLSWDQALSSFQEIRLLDVGAQGRADWVSNGVLYVPIGFLTVHLLVRQKWNSASVWHLVGSLLFSFALAISVEFTQLYFPARTVSLNDLIAEFLGAILGAAIAHQWIDRFRWLLISLRGVNLDRRLTYLLEFYAFLYLAFSIFPFDFIVSTEEFEWKRYADSWGLLIAKDFANSSNVIFLAKLLAEILAVIPLGLLWAHLRSAKQPCRFCAMKAGFYLGLGIEIVQFFLFSGISQGLSVLTRALGFWAGAIIWSHRKRIGIDHLTDVVRQYALILVVVYVAILLVLNGWLDHSWSNMGTAIRVFSEIKFLPFYYHYYTTEQAALLSLIAVALMYVPVGILTWSTRNTPATMAFLMAALLAFGIEASKLFLEGLHPDPTNILVAGASAWGAAKLGAVLSVSFEYSVAEFRDPNAQPDQVPAGKSINNNRPAEAALKLWPLSGLGTVCMSGVLFLVAWGVTTFPVFSIFLGIFLAGYSFLLWGRPHLMLLLLPAASALFDFAPWSGRFFFDEFDLLLLVTVMIGYLRTRPVLAHADMDKLYLFTFLLLGLSYLCSTLIGVLPWRTIDANSFTHYYSPFNAIRVAKGALWAFLLYGLFVRFVSARQNAVKLFALGMAGGVAGTVLVVIWERLIFPGFLNFSDIYRVTGPFSQMHVGGADLEGYLTLGAPFLIMLIIDKGSTIWVRIATSLILLGATYSVMVSFSRVGYVAYGLALVITAIAATRRRADEESFLWLKRGVLSLVLSFAILGIALPIYFGQFAQERMSLVGADLESRLHHWRDALKMRDTGWVAAVFGMGIGRYPETHFWRSEENRAAPYWLGNEAGKEFLRLGTGNPLYFEQIISVKPNTEYIVEINARTDKPNAQLTVSICEKWLLTSARCGNEAVSIKGNGVWQRLRISLSSGEVGHGSWYASRPVKFSLHNSSQMASIDLGGVKLTDESAQSKIANGDFSNKLDHWFFSVDQDLPWHAWSLPVQIFFDQGWLGIVAFTMFVGLGVVRGARKGELGNFAAGSAFAASVGFILIGVFDSLIDSPRLLQLFLLIICIPSLPELIQLSTTRAYNGK